MKTVFEFLHHIKGKCSVKCQKRLGVFHTIKVSHFAKLTARATEIPTITNGARKKAQYTKEEIACSSSF